MFSKRGCSSTILSIDFSETAMESDSKLVFEDDGDISSAVCSVKKGKGFSEMTLNKTL